MLDKNDYRRLCEAEPTIPLFSRDWWLDAVCGEENWDVAVVEKGDRILGTMPYWISRKFGLTIIRMPPLTQTMGPWVRPVDNQSYYRKLSDEAAVLSDLIGRLPQFDYFYQNFHYSVTNWLPFYWENFNQTTRYTYIIQDLSDLDKVFASLNHDVRTDIRKAERHVEVQSSEDIRSFYEINSCVFQRQNLEVPYSFDLVQRLDSTCHQKDRRRILVAKDPSDNIHAAIYFVWEKESAYGLMSGINPDFSNTGAMKLLVWEAIKYANGVTKRFDFSGSMVKQIEKAFRGYGTQQVPYFNISKANGLLPKMIDFTIQGSSSSRLARRLRKMA